MLEHRVKVIKITQVSGGLTASFLQGQRTQFRHDVLPRRLCGGW